MNYLEFGFGGFSKEIAAVAEKFDLNLDHLDIEFFSPGHQGIFVETVNGRRFRIHLSLEEDRIVAVKQLDLNPSEKIAEDLLAKYKNFMK
jgi:hypothetical protein